MADETKKETNGQTAAEKREALIKQKMLAAGMTRENAEHVIDQQAKEDKERKK